MMPPDDAVLPPFPGPMLVPPPGTVPTGLMGNCTALLWWVDCVGPRPKIPPLEPTGTVPLALAVELVLVLAPPTAETVPLLLFPAGPVGPLPAAAWA